MCTESRFCFIIKPVYDSVVPWFVNRNTSLCHVWVIFMGTSAFDFSSVLPTSWCNDCLFSLTWGGVTRCMGCCSYKELPACQAVFQNLLGSVAYVAKFLVGQRVTRSLTMQGVQQQSHAPHLPAWHTHTKLAHLPTCQLGK